MAKSNSPVIYRGNSAYNIKDEFETRTGTFAATSNQLVLGTTNTTTISATAPASSITLTIPDAGTNANFILSESAQTINGAKTFSSTITGDISGNAGTVTDGAYLSASQSFTGANTFTQTITGDISGNAGTVTNGAYINVTNSFTSAQNILATTNQLVLGTTNTTTISATAPSASRVYTMPDVGGNADFVMTAGAQTIGGAKEFSADLVVNARIGINTSPSSNYLLHASTSTSDAILAVESTAAGTPLSALSLRATTPGDEFLLAHRSLDDTFYISHNPASYAGSAVAAAAVVAIQSGGNVTLGPVSDSLVHTLNGSIAVTTAPSVSFSNIAYKSIGSSSCQLLLSDGTTTTDDMFLFGGGYYSGANHYAQENNTNLTRIGLYGTTSLSTIAFRVDRMRDGATDFTSTGQVTTQDTLVNLGNVTASGAWTLGPSGFTGNHTIWGNVGIGTTSPDGKLEINGGAQTQGVESALTPSLIISGTNDASSVYGAIRWDFTGDGITPSNYGFMINGLTSGGSRKLFFQYDDVPALQLNQSGAVTLGPSGGGVVHKINGQTGFVPDSDSNGTVYIQWRNAADSSTIATVTRATASTVAYNTSSDERLKENFMDSQYGLSTVLAVPVWEYDYIEGKDHHAGWKAQEMHLAYPNAVQVGGEDARENPWMIDYSKVTPVLWKAIQELNAKVEALKGASHAL